MTRPNNPRPARPAPATTAAAPRKRAPTKAARPPAGPPSVSSAKHVTAAGARPRVPKPSARPATGRPSPGRTTSGVGAPEDQAVAATRIVLRPIASPLVLAFVSFGVASFVLSGLQVGLIGAGDTQQVDLLVLLFLTPLQVLTSVFSFLAREALAASGIALIALTWPVTWALSRGLPPGVTTSDVLGLFYLALAVALVVLGIPGLVGKPLLSVVILLAALRFAVSGVYELDGATVWLRVAGVAGYGVCAIAVYGGLALGLEEALRRQVLPLGRLGQARTALQGDVREQVKDLATEPGVRTRL